MGENEQGGMLRTVVVVGLVAMVALIITLGVVGLKTMAKQNRDAAVPPTMMLSMVDKSSITPSSDDGHSAFTAKSKFEWVGDSIHIVTPASATPQYAQYNTELKLVPEGAKRLKVTMHTDQIGPNYAHPWIRYYDGNKNPLSDATYNYFMPVEEKSKMFAVKPEAMYYRVDFESREGMDVYYKNFTMTFYND